MFQRIMTGLLAATALLPVTAVAQDRDGPREGRGQQRIERQADRPQREARRDRGDVRADRGDRGGRDDRGGWDRGDRIRGDRDRGGWDRGDRDRADRDRSGWARGDRDRGGWDRGRDGRGDFRGGWDRGDRFAAQRWNNGWRQDRRYDWSGYRTYNRGAFRLPRYYAPYGWNYGYRRFGIGARIAAPLFASSYWIADPWAYRLPPAWGPYRWVRYYGDALLIDLRTGQVVDVVNEIFSCSPPAAGPHDPAAGPAAVRFASRDASDGAAAGTLRDFS